MRNPVKSVRFGPATNSSSSHSIILFPNNTQMKNTLSKYSSILQDSYSFGWENFALRTREEKIKYLAAAFISSFSSTKPNKEIAIIAAYYLKLSVDELINSDAGVDHQSSFVIPYKYPDSFQSPSTYEIDAEFLTELKDFLLQDNLVILGGNDNEESVLEESLKQFQKDINLPKDTRNIYFSRKDPSGFWTLFCPTTGDKIRTTFLDNIDVDKGSYLPELVDIKITDYCSFECDYCYQGSSKKGKHASSVTIRDYIHALEELKVFEIAIGGGEPTQHEEFDDLLNNTFHYSPININFTTRNFTWLLHNSSSIISRKKAIKIGFSIDTPKELQTLIKIISNDDKLKSNIKVQYIYNSNKELPTIVEMCNEQSIDLLLLGWKDSNRGKNTIPLKPFSFKTFEFIVSKSPYNMNISIDTNLAAQLKNQLDKSKISAVLYEIKDGLFSTYIDIVSGRMAQSSYDYFSYNIPLKAYTSRIALANEIKQTYFNLKNKALYV